MLEHNDEGRVGGLGNLATEQLFHSLSDCSQLLTQNDRMMAYPNQL